MAREVRVDLDVVTDNLRAGAGVIEAQVRGIGSEQARWKPAADQWSILEVVNHLADEEVEDFRPRLDATLRGEPWVQIDPTAWPSQRGYQQSDLTDTLSRFLEERSGSLEWLAELEVTDWSPTHEHPRLGTLTAGDVLTSWVAHDLIHVRQINRLRRAYLVDALAPHSPEYAGPW